jgi:hypothetical protein
MTTQTTGDEATLREYATRQCDSVHCPRKKEHVKDFLTDHASALKITGNNDTAFVASHQNLLLKHMNRISINTTTGMRNSAINMNIGM